MSDKKKKPGKGGGKEEGGGEVKVAAGADPLALELYELKMRDLAEKVDKAKDKYKLLQSENEMLLKAQTKSVSEKQDIVEFLRIELANHEKTLAETEDRLHSLEQEKQFLLRVHQAELEGKEAHLRENHEQLTQRIAKLTNDLQDLAVFRGRKETMEQELAALVSTLQDKEREYREEVTSMERKHLQDKHQLKREMMTRVTDAVNNFRRVADTQMAETTKRALRENLVATSQLRKMATKTTELIAENESLKEANTKLRIEADILREGQSQLARKTAASHQVIRRLLSKLEAADLNIDKEDQKILRHTVSPSELNEVLSRGRASESANSSPQKRSPAKNQHLDAGADSATSRIESFNEEYKRISVVTEMLNSVVQDLADNLARVYATQIRPPTSPTKPSSAPFNSTSPTRVSAGLRRPHQLQIIDPDAIVPPVVKRFANDLKSQRASVSLHYPRPQSPPGVTYLKPGDQPSSIQSSTPEKPEASPASKQSRHSNAISTRKNVNLDLLLPHLPIPSTATPP